MKAACLLRIEASHLKGSSYGLSYMTPEPKRFRKRRISPGARHLFEELDLTGVVDPRQDPPLAGRIAHRASGILTLDLLEAIIGGMSRRISIAEARDQLPELVDAAEHGQPIELTREGRSVAALVSLEEYRGSVSSPPNLWAAIQEFRQTHDLSDLEDIEEVYAGLRDPSPGRALDE